jgi:hypothetical protein
MAEPKKQRRWYDIPQGKSSSDSKMRQVSAQLYESLNTPISLSCYLLLKYREERQLIEKSVRPIDYLQSDWSRFRDDYLAVSFLSKYPSFKLDFNREEVAYRKFMDSELTCAKTNRRFQLSWTRPEFVPRECSAILATAARKISKILGPAPSVAELRELGWGPGSTTAVGGDDTSPYAKFRGRLDVSDNCVASAKFALSACPAWVNYLSGNGEVPSIECDAEIDLTIVAGSNLLFVPKNAKTDRAICVEPALNSFIQRGIGRQIRSALRRAGCDLSTQLNNQEAARKSSVDGRLATLDLSSASDSIAYCLVQDLLPFDWFDLLDCARSPTTSYKGRLIHQGKFSSMGNGYTFELETLIFLAIARSVASYLKVDSSSILVYGDDLVVPVEIVDLLVNVLDFCGFKLNAEKSYHSNCSVFRESCGKDYFDGHDVRPIFLREELSNVESLYKLANALRRLGHRRNFGYGCDRQLWECWSTVVRWVPKHLRYKIPDGVGDTGLVSNWDEASPSRNSRKRGFEGWTYNCLGRVSVGYRMTDDHLKYVVALYVAGPCERSLDEMATLRRRTKVVKQQGRVNAWPDLGSWY